MERRGTGFRIHIPAWNDEKPVPGYIFWHRTTRNRFQDTYSGMERRGTGSRINIPAWNDEELVLGYIFRHRTTRNQFRDTYSGMERRGTGFRIHIPAWNDEEPVSGCIFRHGTMRIRLRDLGYGSGLWYLFHHGATRNRFRDAYSGMERRGTGSGMHIPARNDEEPVSGCIFQHGTTRNRFRDAYSGTVKRSKIRCQFGIRIRDPDIGPDSVVIRIWFQLVYPSSYLMVIFLNLAILLLSILFILNL